MENVGGQAVIEGVMMRAPKWVVTAVRKSSGKIVYKKEKTKSLTSKPILKWPFIRGVIVMFESLVLGIKALNYSAKEASEEDEEEINAKLSGLMIFFSLAFSIILALFLFKFIPLAAVQYLNLNFKIFENKYIFNVMEGFLKFLIFLGYILIIAQFKDIKRVFEYHGAEHKTVNCYEKEKSLKVKNAKKYSTVHRRCGTSFLFFVIFISILVYIFLPLEISFLAKLALRIALLPLIAGISYEILKLSSRYEKNLLFSILVSPGLLIQKITTSEPDEKQLEVAIFALKKAMEN